MASGATALALGLASAVAAVRALLPEALLVTIRPPPDEFSAHQTAVQSRLDMALRSFEEALAFVAPAGIGVA